MGAVKSTLAGYLEHQDFAGIDDRVRDASDNPLQRLTDTEVLIRVEYFAFAYLLHQIKVPLQILGQS